MDELSQAGTPIRSFCTFRAQQQLLGIEVCCVREVSTPLPLTPVPQAPTAVRGLVNLRSQIYLILDLRPLLGLPPLEPTPDARLVILQPRAIENVGILVDCGGDIVSASQAQIEESVLPGTAPGEAGDTRRLSFIVGVCKLEHELLMIIDPKKLVDAIVRLT